MLDMEQDFNMESLFIKNIFIMKNLTELRKTVETGVDARLNIILQVSTWKQSWGYLRYGLNKNRSRAYGADMLVISNVESETTYVNT